MRIIWVVTVPLGLIVFLMVGFSNAGNSDQRPDPDDIDLIEKIDYQWKSEGYAKEGRRQEALDTCAAMELVSRADFNETTIDICFLKVYQILEDIDSEITIFEKMLAKELADGDTASAASTRRVLDRLIEERQKKR